MRPQFWIMSALIFSVSVPVVAAKWVMTPISRTDAMAEFKRICVAKFLDESALTFALKSDSKKWTALKPLPKGYIPSGRYWRSKTGEVGYVSQPGHPTYLNDPACHFTFVRSADDTHDALVELAVKELDLGQGRDTEKPSILQRRWDYEDVGGVKSRIFVTSNIKSDGLVVSRFSISKHRIDESASKAY